MRTSERMRTSVKTKMIMADNVVMNDDGQLSSDDKQIRTMVYLKDFDTTLNIWDIESIDRVSRFVEHPRARWQYGISINRGIEPSSRYPRVDIEAWYENRDYRDKRYMRLLNILENYNIKIIVT